MKYLLLLLLFVSCTSTVGPPTREIMLTEGGDVPKAKPAYCEEWAIGEWVSDTFDDPNNDDYYHRTLSISDKTVEIKCYQNDRLWEHTFTLNWLMYDSILWLWDRKEVISGYSISGIQIKYRNKLELYEPSVAREEHRWVKYRKAEQ